jgi:CheY-like chemotaxis protein
VRILVVDDGDDIREALRVLLDLDGHEVDTASNGVEAIYKVRVQPPDVILMDLGMPVMDGFAAVRALRQLPETREIPVIAVSAYVGDKAWSDRAFEAGCNECVLKPVDSKKLAALLRQFAPTPEP